MLGYETIKLRDRCYELWLQNVQVTTRVATKKMRASLLILLSKNKTNSMSTINDKI